MLNLMQVELLSTIDMWNITSRGGNIEFPYRPI